ncbi:MAG: HD domain-containing protein [Gammaproteobacteria bacterium]|nr:HD domain-containing protein [Gammaproteobacteria bacterium]
MQRSKPPFRSHAGLLDELNQLASVREKFTFLHEVLLRQFPPLERIAAAVYDKASDELKTFMASDLRQVELRRYSARLADSPSLKEIAESGQPRVVDDIDAFDPELSEHTREIVIQGYRSSYTMPMYMDGEFAGLLFFDATEPGFFVDSVLGSLDPFGHLISLTVIRELALGHTLQGAIRTARHFAEQRDNDTGAHLDRMSRYARLIALEVAEEEGLSDEQIEFIFLFAPLHDIGKIGIPDSVLLKPGRLTDDEFRTMQRHVDVGCEIVDRMIVDFRLTPSDNIAILRNIVHHHHEAYDGSGYPSGLAGEAIPIEARIVAAADIYDALTSRRPYKRAWSHAEAVGIMADMSGSKLDPRCVRALAENPEELAAIRRRFAENRYG